MILLALTAQEFGTNGRDWVEAISGVLDVTIAKVGVLGLAIIAVYQNLKSRAEIKERLDRQGERIDQVALATPPAGSLTGKPAAENISAEAQPTTATSHSEVATEERT
jgi:hypothetical protein